MIQLLSPLSPQSTDVNIAIEFDNIVDWAHIKKLIVDTIKNEEIVFHRPHFSTSLLPSPVRDILNKSNLLSSSEFILSLLCLWMITSILSSYYLPAILSNKDSRRRRLISFSRLCLFRASSMLYSFFLAFSLALTWTDSMLSEMFLDAALPTKT